MLLSGYLHLSPERPSAAATIRLAEITHDDIGCSSSAAASLVPRHAMKRVSEHVGSTMLVPFAEKLDGSGPLDNPTSIDKLAASPNTT